MRWSCVETSVPSGYSVSSYREGDPVSYTHLDVYKRQERGKFYTAWTYFGCNGIYSGKGTK